MRQITWLSLACFAWFAGASVAVAGTIAPVLDVAAVPYLDPTGRASYADFLLINLPRAFALASNGMYGWFGGAGRTEDARAKALQSCRQKGGADCMIYAEDLQVVWRGATPVTLAQPPAMLLADRGNDFALVPDPRFLWQGPGEARGALVWAHGRFTNRDLRNEQPQEYIRAFNNAGFDVIRFDRAPFTDYTNAAADFLREGLAKLRQTGWRMVIVAGQSRGAWNGLQMLDTPGLTDAVIAVSPADFGFAAGQQSAEQEASLYRVVHAAHSPGTRVAVVQFIGDGYVQDVAERTATLNDLAPPRVAAAMLILRPEGITGHGGGDTASFALRYGHCLLRFVTDPVPPENCGP